MIFHTGRAGVVVTALALASLAGPAFAQATKAAPAPAAPGVAPPVGAPTGPVKLDLIPMQSPWTKICGKDQGANKEVCYTTRDFGQAADQPPTLAVAVYQMSN